MGFGERRVKYAIKIPLGDDWLYVTNNDVNDIPVILTYDTIEDAKKDARLWIESVIVEYIDYDKISRVEVIGSDGREYVRYFKEDESMYYMIQDEGRTLKIVIEDNAKEYYQPGSDPQV